MRIWTHIAAAAALAATTVIAQAPSGEIGGRITDKEHSPIPGVRMRIGNGNETREAMANEDGRFSFTSLTMGTYRVVAELAGFKTASGTITLSPTTTSAFLAWSLELGCLSEFQRVVLRPRDAARLVDSIVHMRVAGPARSVLISIHPDCEARVLHQYSVQVLDSWPERGRTIPGQRAVSKEPRGAPLVPGQEYIALLWPDGPLLWPNGSTSDELILPIISGRVASPDSGDLNGLLAREALNVLATWAEEGRR